MNAKVSGSLDYDVDDIANFESEYTKNGCGKRKKII